jgi:DNA modification methylase
MIDIRQGDCKELIKDIPDHSVDLIFCDPPYTKEQIYLYDWLTDQAVRVMKQDGFIAMYVGIYHLATVIKMIGDRLDYFMELVLFGTGYGSMLWNRRTIGRHKSILLYTLPNSTAMPRTNIVSLFNGTRADKRYHIWGQDEASARYYIDCLSEPGDLVLDPFAGGGYNGCYV